MSLIYYGRDKLLIICSRVYACHLFTNFDVLKITVPCIEHYLSVYDNLFLSKIMTMF